MKEYKNIIDEKKLEIMKEIGDLTNTRNRAKFLQATYASKNNVLRRELKEEFINSDTKIIKKISTLINILGFSTLAAIILMPGIIVKVIIFILYKYLYEILKEKKKEIISNCEFNNKKRQKEIKNKILENENIIEEIQKNINAINIEIKDKNILIEELNKKINKPQTQKNVVNEKNKILQFKKKN